MPIYICTCQLSILCMHYPPWLWRWPPSICCSWVLHVLRTNSVILFLDMNVGFYYLRTWGDWLLVNFSFYSMCLLFWFMFWTLLYWLFLIQLENNLHNYCFQMHGNLTFFGDCTRGKYGALKIPLLTRNQCI